MKKTLIIIAIVVAAIILLGLAAYALDLIPDDLFESSSTQKTTRIKLDTYETTLQVGETYQLTASAKKQLVLRWKSSDEDVAIVNSNGMVTAKAPGVANITCYASYAVEASCTITVEEGLSGNIDIDIDIDSPSSDSNPSIPSTPSSAPTAIPSYPSTPSTENSDFIFPHASIKYLTLNEAYSRLSVMSGTPISGSFAQDAVNEIYARNGYVFQDSDLSSYYNSQSWYYPDPNFSFSNLNAYEMANITLLQELVY